MLSTDEFEKAVEAIDQELKAEGVPPHARAFHAVRKFGQRFQLSMPFTRPIPGAPNDLFENWPYSEAIFQWFAETYGERNKIDPSDGRKVAVLADGDLWELRLPLVWGSIVPTVERRLTEPGPNFSRTPPQHNISNNITNITGKRLEKFTDNDVNEVYGQFVVGLDVCNAIDRFRDSSPLFTEAQHDLSTAVAMLVAQSPSYGQSRWASQQFAEKYLKGIAKVIGIKPAYNHNLMALHDKLAEKIVGMNFRELIGQVECKPAVRYGEQTSTRAEAYAAHKSSLLLVRVVGSIRW